MIKHFCDLCGKQIADNNTAIKNYRLLESLNGVNGLQFTVTSEKELCYGCAKALVNVSDALTKHYTIIIK